jgi:transcriptional regulator with XRE-family HTH domain
LLAVTLRQLTLYVNWRIVYFMETWIMAETAFGRRLAELRKAAGMSQSELAEKSGVSAAGIRNLEQGRREPALGTAIALARGLGVGVGEFDEPPASRAKAKPGRPKTRKDKK